MRHPCRAGAVTIGGGRTGINKADAALDRPLRETLGIAKVVLYQIAHVRLGGRGAGAEVKDGADRIKAFGLALETFETFEEGIGLLVVGEARGERFFHFSSRPSTSVTRMSSCPRWFRAWIRALPMSPARPVTRMDGSMGIGGGLLISSDPLLSSSSWKVSDLSPKTLISSRNRDNI